MKPTAPISPRGTPAPVPGPVPTAEPLGTGWGWAAVPLSPPFGNKPAPARETGPAALALPLRRDPLSPMGAGEEGGWAGVPYGSGSPAWGCRPGAGHCWGCCKPGLGWIEGRSPESENFRGQKSRGARAVRVLQPGALRIPRGLFLGHGASAGSSPSGLQLAPQHDGLSPAEVWPDGLCCGKSNWGGG